MDNNLKYVGKSYPVHDAIEKVTGKAVYTVDMRPRNMLWSAMLFSPVAHAKIKSIDTSEAEALAGVHYIATYKNSPDYIYNSGRRFIGHNMKPDEQLFSQEVRYVGDRVAAVAADTKEIADKACKLIKVEYEELPFYIDVEEAVKPDAYPLHQGGNILGEMEVKAGDVEKALAESDRVFEGRYELPTIHHYAMEPHTSMADWDGKNLTIWSSTQNIFSFRMLTAEILGLPFNRVRMIRPTVGGGFGGKYEMTIEPVAGLLAMKTGRPVMLELSRKDSMISTRVRHSAVMYLKVGVNNDGKLNAIDYNILFNAGAYASATMNVAGGASAKSMMLYRLEHTRYRATGVYTSTPVGGAMRGYGSPQVVTPVELMMDRVAKEMQFDPIEFRLKNLVNPGDLHPAKKISVGNSKVKECLKIGKEIIHWDDTVTTRDNGRYRRAMGFACGVHGNGVAGIMIDPTGIMMKFADDGSLYLFTGTQDIGQGNSMVLKQIAGEVLQIDPETIQYVEADTTNTLFDMGTFASRCTWVGGSAAKKVAEMMVERLKAEASLMLEKPVEDLMVKDGSIICISDNSISATYGELAVYSQQVSCNGELIVLHNYYSQNNPGSYACDLAEVEVDTLTGEVKVLNFAAVHDVGKAVNPMMLEGQIEGGVQMGLGYGLREELTFDPLTGKPANAHTKKYKMFYAKDMPPVKIALVEDYEPNGPFGAKSIGEIATVAVGACVVNAVNRALGTNITSLPVTPGKILAAVKEQGG